MPQTQRNVRTIESALPLSRQRVVRVRRRQFLPEDGDTLELRYRFHASFPIHTQPRTDYTMSYQALHDRCQRIGDLNHAIAMLYWDKAVMMPNGGVGARTDAIAALEDTARSLLTDSEMGDLAERAAAAELDSWQAANVAHVRRARRKAQAVPPDLAIALSKAAATCEQTWRSARAANDWSAVAGALATVLDLTRQRAAALGEALGCSPYDALLDDHEPGLTQQIIEPIFAELGTALIPLIERALDRQPPARPIAGPFANDRQAALGHALMRALGFDFDCGRLDVSHHPFCGGEPDDTRITTRYDEDDFLKSMFAVLHETGHALYQQGLPKAWRGQPVGEASGMALHESQSLTMEMQVSRSAAFLEFATPLVQRSLLGAPTDASEWQPANLHKLATRVERGFIRVDADELTYPLHVLLRYELEMAMIAGDLEVADLPQAWDERMTQYLELSTKDDFANGVMQDTHWFGGLFGYFPSYTLGAVIAAQLFRTARQQLPGLDDSIRQGRFVELLAWLRDNVHSRARLSTTFDLVLDVTGEELGTTAFLSHLRTRYGY